MTHAFLPALRSTLDAHITNMSSLYGLMGVVGQTAYSSSKFAVRGFSESLRQELGPLGIGVTSVHPGGIKTNIANTARLGSGVSQQQGLAGRDTMNKVLKLPPEQAARLILQGTQRRAPRVLFGLDATIADSIVRLLPSSYEQVIQRLHPVPQPE